MDIDLGAVIALPAHEPEPTELERLVAVVTQMQEGQNAMVDILIAQKKEIAALHQKVARLEVITGAPRSIVKPGDPKWPH